MIKLKQILSELGEATLPPFKYKKMVATDKSNVYMIKITKNINIEFIINKCNYDVDSDYIPTYFDTNDIYKPVNYIISFDLTFKSEKYLFKINPEREPGYIQSGFMSLKQTLRLMSTIVEIIKEFVKTDVKDEYFFFEFEAYKTKLNPLGRENLYMAYLKNNLPPDWIFEKHYDIVYFYPKIAK